MPKLVSGLGEGHKALFHEVLLVCDGQGLIGRELFAIDRMKPPANASKERSGSLAESTHRAQRLEEAADKIVALHQMQNKGSASPGKRALDAQRRKGQRTHEFLATSGRARHALLTDGG